MKVFFFCKKFAARLSYFLGGLKPYHFIVVISVAFPATIFSQTIPLTFTPIPYSAPDIIAPGRGAEQWNNGTEKINNPTPDTSIRSLDVYHRFPWTQLEGPTEGSYTWKYFDEIIKEAIDRKQKLSFGIMPVDDNTGTVVYNTAKSAYPLYLHQAMQADSIDNRDWISRGVWIPNWNSPHYLGRLRALHEALLTHIMASSYKGVPFKNVIYCIDVRGYGNYGEWHNVGIVEKMNEYPKGRRATATTLKTIIDHHTQVFSSWPLMIMAATFDAEQLDAIMNPVEVGNYALTTSNAWGPLGWRRDQWGSTESYLDGLLKYNEQRFENGPPLKDYITSRFKTSPVTGEPPPYISPGGPCQYWDLERQLMDYGATSIGNGNWGGITLTECGKDNIRSAFKKSGYRLILENGNITSTIRAGRLFSVMLNWKNVGIAPTYENWDIIYELKNDSNTVVWSGPSRFDLKLFLPSVAATAVMDTFMLPGNIPVGKYKLNLIIRDPIGYRDPLPLAITGRNPDGSYIIQNVVVSPIDCSPPNATLSTISTCKGQEFDLLLSAATGPGPYELNINGTTYKNIAAGQTIAHFDPPVQKIWNHIPELNNHQDAPVELGMKFKSSVTGIIKGIRFFSPVNPAGTYTAHLWTTGGTLLDSATFINVTPGSWQEVLFANPVHIEADTVYIASYHTTSGHYTGTAGGLTNEVTNGALTALDKNTSGGNGVYKYSVSPGFPSTISSNDASYWVDVLFTPDTYTFNLKSVTDNNKCNNTGDLQTLIITPNNCTAIPAAAITNSSSCNGQAFDLVLDSASGPGPYELVINGTAYRNIAVGQTITTFDPPAQKIWDHNPELNSHQDAPVELGMKFKSSATGFIKGIRFFSPGNPAGIYTAHLWTKGGTLMDSATFTNVTPASWQEVLFTTPVRIVADTVYIASYHTTSGHYTGTAGSLTNAVTNGVLTALDKNTAGGNGVYKYGVSPGFPSTISSNDANYWVDVLFIPDTYTFNLTSVTSSAGSTKSGALQTLTVTSTTTCNTAPVVTIAHSPSCNGQAFDLVLDSASGPGPYELVINNATYTNIEVGKTIATFEPPVQKIWNHNPVLNSHQDAPVELGLKFKSSATGFIKGIRFFPPGNPAGIYTAHLWTTGGTLLDSATFTNVTPGSWQEVLFTNPVHIAADTIYIASYHTTSGRYTGTAGSLTNAITSGALTALDKNTAGGNGVYKYGVSPDFPSTISSNDANYWVDVLFTPDTYTFNLTSVKNSEGSNKNGVLQTLSIVSPECGQRQSTGVMLTHEKHIDSQAVLLSLNNSITPQPVAKKYNLGQNYPNPFRNETIIEYSIPETVKVNLSIFDVNGRLVKVVVNELKEAGSYKLKLNSGLLSQGLYFYKIQTSNYSAVRKMIIH